MSAAIISLPKIPDDRGNLSFLENLHQIPFEIKRVHWIYDVPGGEMRGDVAYKETEEFLLALSGSFDVLVDDGREQKVFHLNRSDQGVYVPRATWRSIRNFSTNSLAVIATSTFYDPQDAIRDYAEFQEFVKKTTLLDLPEKAESPEMTEPAPAKPEQQNPAQALGQIVEKTNCRREAQQNFSVDDCEIITFDRHHSARKGDICVAENSLNIPFDIKRLYYLYDVPADAMRGGHAHKQLYQLVIAAGGSFRVNLDDGSRQKEIYLNRPYQALLIKPGIWREVDDFSSGSVCLVLASELYDENDYIRHYQDFLSYKAAQICFPR